MIIGVDVGHAAEQTLEDDQPEHDENARQEPVDRLEEEEHHVR